MHDNQRSDRRTRSGSRQRRRGGRNSSSHPTSSNSGYTSSSQSRAPKTPVKLTFWQKIASLFGAKPKPAGSHSRTATGGDRQGQPQGGSHRRFESSHGTAPQSFPSPSTPRTVRKPELVEVNSPKLYVGNLSFDAAESDLFELFNGVGKVQNAEVVSNKYTQKSKGFAFVTMLTVEEARRAVTELHDKEFMGRKLVVSGAKTNDGPTRQAAPREESEANADTNVGEDADAGEPAVS